MINNNNVYQNNPTVICIDNTGLVSTLPNENYIMLQLLVYTLYRVKKQLLMFTCSREKGCFRVIGKHFLESRLDWTLTKTIGKT